jgi:hypothetical protein
VADLHVRWRSHPSGIDAPAWYSPDGDAIVSVQRFRDELVRFDHDLIAAMQARVDAVATGRLRPDIAIDVRPAQRAVPRAGADDGGWHTTGWPALLYGRPERSGQMHLPRSRGGPHD